MKPQGITRIAITAVALFLLGNGAALADVKLLGIGEVPGVATDTSGLTGLLEDGTPHNRLGGFGSAIEYTGKGYTYLLAPDRGPADGQTKFTDRIYQAEIKVEKGQVAFKLKKTLLLSDKRGVPFTGAAAAFAPGSGQEPKRLDPEGIRRGPKGGFYLSDEYGPHLFEFNANGQMIGEFEMPQQMILDNPATSPQDELPPNNLKGRAPNRGMEGLALSPDGSRLYGIMQSSLIQDSVDNDGKRLGTNVRIVAFDVATRKPVAQYLYVMDNKKHGLNEILAVNDHELLVIERDGKPGSESKCKKIYKISLRAATDISAVSSLPDFDIPKWITPVKKRLLIDLQDSVFKIPKSKIPEKIEGLTFGPELQGGRRLLLVTSDNDFKTDQPSFIYAFSVSGLVLSSRKD